MAELREDSILFSLNGLLERQRQRVSDEAEREFRRIEAEQLARLERERLALEERERRRQAEEIQAKREEKRTQEAAARLEALRHAEVTRARTEAEAKARIELGAKHREHELLLQGIREKSGRRRAEQLAASFAVVALLMIAGTASAYFVKVRPEQQRARADYERLVFAERARSEQIQSLFEGSERRNAALATSLKRTQVELLDIRASAAQPGLRAKSPTSPGRKPIQTPDRPKPRKPCRDDHDPLNDCLP